MQFLFRAHFFVNKLEKRGKKTLLFFVCVLLLIANQQATDFVLHPLDNFHESQEGYRLPIMVQRLTNLM